MRLAINVGNTNLQLGLWDGVAWTYLAKGPVALAGELIDAVPDDLPATAWIASVNPSAHERLSDALRVRGTHPNFLAWSPALGIRVSYDDPGTIGADRLANALALQAGCPLPSVAVDCGTATTLELVGRDGAFLGGAIMPGIGLMRKSLGRDTALLPEVEVGGVVEPVGTDTDSAIRAGLLYGHAGAIERLVAEYEATVGARLSVVLAGGAAPVLRPILRLKAIEAPELTLQGLVVAADRLG